MSGIWIELQRSSLGAGGCSEITDRLQRSTECDAGTRAVCERIAQALLRFGMGRTGMFRLFFSQTLETSRVPLEFSSRFLLNS